MLQLLRSVSGKKQNPKSLSTAVIKMFLVERAVKNLQKTSHALVMDVIIVQGMDGPGHSQALVYVDVIIVDGPGHSHTLATWMSSSCRHGCSGHSHDLVTRTHAPCEARMDVLAIRIHWQHGRHHLASMHMGCSGRSLAVSTRA